MPEEDAKIFGEAYEIWQQWRSVLITELSQWEQLTADFEGLAVRHPESRLALRLAIGMMDSFDDLYKDGRKPAVADYIGREDLS